MRSWKLFCFVFGCVWNVLVEHSGWDFSFSSDDQRHLRDFFSPYCRRVRISNPVAVRCPSGTSSSGVGTARRTSSTRRNSRPPSRRTVRAVPRVFALLRPHLLSIKTRPNGFLEVHLFLPKAHISSFRLAFEVNPFSMFCCYRTEKSEFSKSQKKITIVPRSRSAQRSAPYPSWVSRANILC